MSNDIVKSEFQIMDEMDNQQIKEAETSIKQALAYEVRGKKQLSYMGVKWLVLKMSQKDQALEIVDMPIIELMKHDIDNEKMWHWYVTIKARNLKTGLVTIGASESPFFEYGKYDMFGRTKAISKAERNAYRKQIPEIEINSMLDTIPKNDVKTLDTSPPPQPKAEPQNTKPNPVDPKYLETLKSLGYTGLTPKTSFEAANIIHDLKKDVTVSITTSPSLLSYNNHCTGDNIHGVKHNFIPNEATKGLTCQVCKKLAPIEVD